MKKTFRWECIICKKKFKLLNGFVRHCIKKHPEQGFKAREINERHSNY